MRRGITLAYTVLFIIFMFSAVSAQEREPVAVEVVAYADDSLGERLVYKVREEIRSSYGYRLTEYDEERIQIMVNTIGLSDELEGEVTFYSIIWLFTDEEYSQIYLSDTMGICPREVLDDTAEQIVARTDQLITEITKAFQSSW